MKISLKLSAILLVLLAIGLNGCKKKEEELALKAIIIAPSSGVPFEQISLDGSTSENATSYEWTINGLGSPNFVSTSSGKGYFIPENTGAFNITLRVTNGSEFNETFASITISGAIELSGTLTEGMTLTDVNSNPAECDYYVSSDLIIPSGVTLTLDGNAGICVADDVAIIVESGGNLVATNTNTIEALTDHWKGIHFQSGSSGQLTALYLRQRRRFFLYK